MPNVIGLDMGSAFVKGVLICENGETLFCKEKAGKNYRETAHKVKNQLLSQACIECVNVFATGCGERCIDFPVKHVGEMQCLVRAVSETEKNPCLILDMGGQSTRLCVMNAQGCLEAFDYSARCASGSGKVLENIARVLHMNFAELSVAADNATVPTAFTVSCAVFAESEAVTALAKGESKDNIIAGFHDSLCKKFAAMLNKYDSSVPVVITGGMATDDALIRRFQGKCERSIKITKEPQFCIAYGAALLALEGK